MPILEVSSKDVRTAIKVKNCIESEEELKYERLYKNVHIVFLSFFII